MSHTYAHTLEDHLGDTWQQTVDTIVDRHTEFGYYTNWCDRYSNHLHRYQAHTLDLHFWPNVLTVGAVSALMGWYIGGEAAAAAAAGGSITTAINTVGKKGLYTFGGVEIDSGYDDEPGLLSVVDAGWRSGHDECQAISYAPGHPTRW